MKKNKNPNWATYCLIVGSAILTAGFLKNNLGALNNSLSDGVIGIGFLYLSSLIKQNGNEK